MELKYSVLGRAGMHRRLLACTAAAVLIGGGVTAFSAMAAAASDNAATAPAISKSQAPANINPDKHPVLDRAKIKPDAAAPLTLAQQRAQAAAWKAQDPNSRVVCFRPDGSIAGGASLDRVNPSAPLTPAAAAAVCARGYAGSRP